MKFLFIVICILDFYFNKKKLLSMLEYHHLFPEQVLAVGKCQGSRREARQVATPPVPSVGVFSVAAEPLLVPFSCFKSGFVINQAAKN